MKGKDIFALIIFIAISELAGVIGSFFTVSAIPTWYTTLVRPELSPPNWVFGPVWTTLYVLMGIAAFLVWRKGVGRRDVHNALFIFALQLVLNASWSVVFFGMHNILWALIIIGLLWLTILWMIVTFQKISRPTLYLLLPYILWVTFASYLNYSIFVLN